MSDLAAMANTLAMSAKAKAMAAATNTEGRTCAGCIGSDRNCKYCAPLRQAELCQKQVYVRVTLARLIVELVGMLVNAGMGEAIIREVIGNVGAVLGNGCGELLADVSG